MTRITDFAEAEKLLAGYVPLARHVTGRDITLERMRPLMDVLGNPERRLKIIHIAGTSGKTSTAYYIATLLQLSGNKVGLTVSPHVDSVAERVQINLTPLDVPTFCGELSDFLVIIEQNQLKPTYFELLIAFAYWYFDKAKVDYAVVETGLGGLQDGTNIADKPDKLCVITDIGLDHMHILGSTVAQIARQKAGIIHPGNTAIMLSQPEEVTRVITDWCNENQAKLKVHSPTSQDQLLQSLPEFQRRNWALAYEAYKYLGVRDGLTNLTPDVLEESVRVQIPGRMQTRKIGDKTVIMDGAHNEQKMQAFTSSFAERYPGLRVPVLLSLKQGKELAVVLQLIKPITSKLFVTIFEQGQDLPIPAIDAGELAAAAEKFGFDAVVAEPDKDKAYDMFMREASQLAIITGSFYLIGQLRQGHKELQE